MKKDLVSTPLVIKEEENLDDLILKQLINYGYKQDFLPNQVLQLLANRANYSKNLIITDCINIDSRLHYQDCFYILNYHVLQFCLCCLHYNFSYADHLGIGNIYELLYKNYYWPNMQDFVKKYVCYSNTYKCSKGSRFKKQGIFWLLLVLN